MAADFSKHIYNSRKWRGTGKQRGVRKAYLDARNWLCERCDNPAEVVHHIIPITPENVHDLDICYGWENLECLCRDCHEEEHQRKRGVTIAADVKFDGEEIVKRRERTDTQAMSQIMAGIVVR